MVSPKKKLFRTLDCLYALIKYMFDFVQEMGDLKLALYGAGTITHCSSLLVLICDAKTWSPKKKIKLFRTLDCLMRWSGVWLCTRDGRLKAGPSRGWCHPKYLFLSLDLWCKDLVQKNRIKLFRTLDCLMRWSGV